MVITHKIKMDLSRRGITPVVHMVQGDSNTRALEISLYDNGQPWELPAGATAAVAFQKPDGTRGLYDKLPDGSAATTISGSTVTAILAPQALTCAGIVLASIVFYDADQDVLATYPFKIMVESNPAAGELISNDYHNPTILDIDAATKDLDRRVKALEEGGGGYSEADKAEFSAYIASELAKRGQLKPEFAQTIAECTDTTKLYVLPDGMIYAYMYAEVAEGGYTNCVKKTDSLFECPKRINASFQVVSSSSSNAFVSNYIPAQAQQVLRMKGIDNGDFRILCYKEDGTYVFGFEMASGSSTKQILDRTTIDENGVWTYTLGHSGNGADHDFDNRGIAQIRIGGTAVNGIDNIIVTVDEEIVEHDIVKEYRWASTGHAFVPADYEGWLIALEAEDLKIHKEILNAKEEASEAIADLQEQIDSGAASAKSGARWFALGDSITEGYASSFNADGSYKQYIAAVGKRWVDIVAKRNGYQLTNYGAGGTGYYYATTNARAQVENIDFTKCDFVTLAYGCNDWKYDGSVIGTEADVPQTVVSNYNGHNSIKLADGTASNVVVYKNGVLLTVNTDYTISGGYLVLKSDTLHNDRFDLYPATESMVANMSYVIKKILWQNPLCKIFVITPINCKALGTYTSNWGINYAGTGGCGKPLQYVYEMQKYVCDQYGIELIDMTHNSVVNRENLRDVLADGIHPTEACHEQMARELARKIQFV